MKDKSESKQSLPKGLPKSFPKEVRIVIAIKDSPMKYSMPKLHIPKGKDGKPTLDKPWYVWFNYRNPETGKFDNKSNFKSRHGINRYYKTVEGRKAYGQGLVETYTKLLEQGYDPYTNTLPVDNVFDSDSRDVLLGEAVRKALEDKKLSWSHSTYKSTAYRIEEFIEFLEKNYLDGMPASSLKRVHIVEFLKDIKRRGLSLTSVNNYRNALSGILSQMIENNHIQYNLCNDIKRERAKAVKNHPFSVTQVEQIKGYLKENNPYLLSYIRMISYGFLRNSEVLRLRVQDIDLKERIITVKTKSSALEKIYIIDQLMEEFRRMGLENYRPDDFVFTRKGSPGPWDAELRTKKKFFSDGFRPVKKKFNLGKEYTLYSFRHTFAVNLYNHFIDSGLSENEALYKMLPITRHRSIEMASNYVREKRKMLPQDYSSKITLEL